eukprot:COSAG04_NODE_26597_length_293_cov_0.685567_1_plen_68_part_10
MPRPSPPGVLESWRCADPLAPLTPMGRAANRRLGATLSALRPCAAALDPRSAAFGSGAGLRAPGSGSG